jgi:arsenate reductase
MNVLFLCTGNSARSILAEVLLNDLGRGRFRAFSAGSHPTGQVNPAAIHKLAAEGHNTAGLESKSWDRFSGVDALDVDLVITVCDSAAGEACPLWNGAPVTAHWGIPDPAYVDDVEAREAAFDIAYTRLRRRIEALVRLEPAFRADELQQALQEIHEQARAADIANA